MRNFLAKNSVKLMLLTSCFFVCSCSITRYVPEDKLLLDKVNFKSDVPDLKTEQLSTYLQQAPNSYMFSLLRMKLAMYNASNPDTTRAFSRWLRKIGEAPVIYDSLLEQSTREELERVLHNRGYYNGTVDVLHTEKNQKMRLTYVLEGNEPYTIRSYRVELPNEATMAIVEQRDSANILKKGQIFDIELLEKERESITSRLRNRGYYHFQKDMLGFMADSVDRSVDVLLHLQKQYRENDSLLTKIFTKKTVRNVFIYNISNSDNLLLLGSDSLKLDTTFYQGYTIVCDNKKKRVRAPALVAKTFISPHSVYNERQVTRTYEGLNNLPAVRYVNVEFRDIGNDVLECNIFISPEKEHSFSVNVEGTNSDGNLGVAAGVSYQNRNIFKGSETLKVGVSGAYEAMRKNSRFYNSAEIGGEIGVLFPSLLIPASTAFKRQTLGTTELSLGYNFQRRPMYSRNIGNIAFKYAWTKHRINYTFSLLDLSLVYLPHMTDDFRARYLSPSSSLRFSYEDHFIAEIGFGLSYTNRRKNNGLRNFYNVRASVKTAGNLFYGISKWSKQERVDGTYRLLNVPYSQYVKGDFNFAYNQIFDNKISLVWHAGLGVAFPYGNANILPFEKRYFSGGANSLRGWSVRSLGPGSYKNRSGYIDYMNQSGDIKLDLNVEARFKLFWKLEGAAFIDAGNIWTIKDYPEQPGGQFRWNSFYKEIGCSYGIGLRLNFDFFVLRVDMGMKLYDPSYEQNADRWRTSLTWKDDVSFHFAVGYPF